MTWHVYLIRARDDSLYTGIATDVERRLAEHGEAGPKGAKSLRGRGPLSLVLNREIGSRETALRVEWAIKRMPRQMKEEPTQHAPSSTPDTRLSASRPRNVPRR